MPNKSNSSDQPGFQRGTTSNTINLYGHSISIFLYTALGMVSDEARANVS